MTVCTRVTVVLLLCMLLSVSVVAYNHDSEDAPTDAVDLGEIENRVDVETPSGLHMYYRAYVADAEDVSEDGIEEWTPVPVDASLYAPDNVWDLQLGSEPQLFRDSAEVDLSEFDPGFYYIFLWGCGTEGLSGGMYVPGDCEWLDPFLVEVAGLDAEFRVMYQGKEYRYEDGEWVREGESAELIVEEGDYVEILDVGVDGVDLVRFDEISLETSTVDDLDAEYNSGGGSVIWHADRTGDLWLEDLEQGGVAPVEVRSMCSGGQSWDGEECTSMFNLVAVPLNYAQGDFRAFFHLAEADVAHWAEERSPLRHDYDDPRRTVKLNLLEPDDEYEPTDGEHSGESIALGDVHTDACWAPGPVQSCTAGICVYLGQYDLSQITERAVQMSPFSSRYDKAMGVYHGGDVTIWDPSQLVSGSPDTYGTAGGCANTLSDRFVYSDDFSSAISRQRTMAHELGHALDLCHTRGISDGETCDLSGEPDPAVHPYRHGATCKNDQSLTGTYSIMNYCRNSADDRYWGDPDVGGPDTEDAPYTIVRTWMQHYIEGADQPDPGLAERGLDTRDRIIDTGEDIEDSIRDTPGRIREGAEDTWDRITDAPGNVRDGACDRAGWIPGC